MTYTGVGAVNMAATDDTDPATPAGQPGLSTIANLTFTLPGTADQGVLEDDGTSNTLLQIRSGAATPTFATTVFPAPATLTVNMGADNGALTVASLPDFHKALTINGQAGTDSVTFAGTDALTSLSVTVGGTITNLAGAA